MPTSPVEDIKSRLNITEVIGESLELKKAGTNFKARCPFHNEKSASFMVSPDKQIYHCFGCGEGGDMFNYVMKMEGVEFREALRILAQKAGVELRPPSKKDKQQADKRTRLLEVLEATTKFFSAALRTNEGKTAADYLAGRKLSQKSITNFRLGYAPDSFSVLSNHLKKAGFTNREMADAGVVVLKDDGTVFDRFRHRVMFPITDHNERVVGFTGRILDPEKQKNTGKYVNTPETDLYHKSSILYGLEKAKTSIRRLGAAIIVEGQMDVITSHQAGFTNTVASSGTALTTEQVTLLKRYSPNIFMAFDSDAAGKKAAARAIEVASAQGANIKVIVPPGGKDPDDIIKKDPKRWIEAIKAAKFVMEYYFAVTLEDTDLANPLQKKQAVAELLKQISQITDQIEQTHYLQKLSEEVGISEDILRDVLRKQHKPTSNPRGQSSRHAPSEDSIRPQSNQIPSGPEIDLMAFVVAFPQKLTSLLHVLIPDDMETEPGRTLYSELVTWLETDDGKPKTMVNYRAHLATTHPELAKALDIALLKIDADEDIGVDRAATEIHDRTATIKQRAIRRRISELEANLKKAESRGDSDAIKLLEKQMRLSLSELQGIHQ